MPKFVCAVVDCNATSTFKASRHPFMREVKGWARFPSEKKEAKRRRLWEKRCRRGDEWRATRNHAICSRHFLDWEKKPSPKHPDPVLFLYNGWGKNCWDKITRKPNRAQKYRDQCSADSDIVEVVNYDVISQSYINHDEFLSETVELLVISEGVQDWCETEICSDHSKSSSVNTVLEGTVTTHTAAPYMDHTYTHDQQEPVVYPVAVGIQTDPLTNYKPSSLPSALNERSKTTSQRRQLFIQTVLQNDKSLKRYTGIGSKFLNGIFDMVQSNFININYWKGSKGNTSGGVASCTKRKKEELTNFEEYLLTLVYIRQGFDLSVLADCFEITRSWAVIVVKSWINILATVLNDLLICPSAATVKSCLPPDFPPEYSDTRIILDCTQFFVTTPTTPGNTSHFTVKALIGVTPIGIISFVSKTYGEDTSNAQIFQSEFLSRLKPGDAIMVDKGFNIADLVLRRGAKLYTPPFTRSKSGGEDRTLNQTEIIKTRDIANIWVHMECAIRRLQEFEFLGNEIQANLLSLLDQVLVIVAVLCNLEPSLAES